MDQGMNLGMGGPNFNTTDLETTPRDQGTPLKDPGTPPRKPGNQKNGSWEPHQGTPGTNQGYVN